jgi:hypothetical protein
VYTRVPRCTSSLWLLSGVELFLPGHSVTHPCCVSVSRFFLIAEGISLCGNHYKSLPFVWALVATFSTLMKGQRSRNEAWRMNLTLQNGFHTCFITRLGLRLALSCTLTQHSISTLLPEPKRPCCTPKKGVTQVPSENWSDSLLPPEAGLNLNSGSYKSDEWGSQIGSQAFPCSLCNQNSIPSLTRREAPPLRWTWSSGAWQGQLFQWDGDFEPVTRSGIATIQVQGGLTEMLQEGWDRLRGHQSFQEVSY